MASNWAKEMSSSFHCFTAEEAGQLSRDNFLAIRFFAQHGNGGPRKSSKSESGGSIFWFSVVCVQQIELESIPMV